MTIRGQISTTGEMRIPMSNDIWDDDPDDEEDFDEPEFYINFYWLSLIGYSGRYYQERSQRWFRTGSESS